MKVYKNILLCISACISGFLPVVFGETMAFDLKPLGKMNRIDIELSTGFESGRINGSFSQVAGKINFSVREPKLSNGQVLLDARTLRLGYAKVNRDAHNPAWLDSSTFPKISYTLENLDNLKWRGEIMQANANGKLTIKGRSMPISVPIYLRYLRANRREYDGRNGDILYLTGQFPLSRGQFGINTDTALDSILDLLTVKIQLVAGSDTVRPFLPGRLFGGSP